MGVLLSISGCGKIFRFTSIPLPWRGGVKGIEERLEHVPPRTRGDFRGVTGNPHQVLIQQWIPPSSPPLEKGGRSESNELLRALPIFSHLPLIGGFWE